MYNTGIQPLNWIDNTPSTINYYTLGYTIVLLAIVIAFAGLIWVNRKNLRSLI